jgi:hypothetical protein
MISEFLDYGGNQLFSTVMTDNLNRSEGIDRLVSLLKAYSDRCRKIKVKSGAYRYMLLKAEKNGWLGRGSANLYSHRLSEKERNYIEESVDKYISSGGSRARTFKFLLTAAIIFFVLFLFVFMMWKKVTSDKYQKRISDFYSSQIVIEYVGETAEGLNFSIQTTDNISEFVYMEHMPTLYYITADTETEIDILPENDIREIVFENGKNTEYARDTRSLYSCEPNTLYLSEEDYGITFFPGKYRVEFSFYIYNDDSEKVYLPAVSEEVTVK